MYSGNFLENFRKIWKIGKFQSNLAKIRIFREDLYEFQILFKLYVKKGEENFSWQKKNPQQKIYGKNDYPAFYPGLALKKALNARHGYIIANQYNSEWWSKHNFGLLGIYFKR